MRDVEKGKGVEQGRTSGARSNDSDAWHPDGTGDSACLTLAGDHSPHNSPHNVISRNVTRQLHREERSTGRAPHSIWGTCAFGDALWKTRRRVFVPIPFRRHVTHIDNKNITPIHIRHFIHASTTTRHDTPVSSPFVQANGWTRPTTRN